MIYINQKEPPEFLKDDLVAICLGNFDGLHLGHKKLLQQAKNSGYKTLVLSFEPHPVSVLTKKPFKKIFTSGEKASILEGFGIDYFYEYPFDEQVSSLSAHEFYEQVINNISYEAIYVGEDYCFGRNKSGNVELLTMLSGDRLHIIETETYEHKKIGSSQIRNELSSGNIKLTNKLLGHNYFIRGQVISGNRIGRTLDFPTANVNPTSDKLIPINGVYRTKTVLDGIQYDSLTNVGFRPTVSGDTHSPVIETFIINFDKDIYGKVIDVYFYDFLRPEKRFESLEALKAQLIDDYTSAICNNVSKEDLMQLT